MANRPIQLAVQGSRFATVANPINIQDTLGFPISDSNSFYSMGSQWYFQFMGYAPINFGCAVSKFYLRGIHSWATAYTGAYCEMGLYAGEFRLGRNTTLTRLATTDLFPTVSTATEVGGNTNNRTGRRNIVLTPSSTVAAGTPIWIALGYYAGTGGTGATAPTFFFYANGDVMLSAAQQITYFNFNTAGRSLSSPWGKYIVTQPHTSPGTSNWICSLTYYESRAT